MKKRGFTLAEVLIAMGVIGVIAAMTIPALMTSYREKEWEAKLKKSFAIATTACERMLVEENVAHANETALYTASGSTSDTIKKYFKVLKTPTYTAASGSGATATPASSKIVLPDGVQMTITVNTTNQGFNFDVDLNGDDTSKGRPNEAGADQYAFILDRNCTYVEASTPAKNKCFKAVVDNDWTLPTNPTATGGCNAAPSTT